jgi:hypothetical protein
MITRVNNCNTGSDNRPCFISQYIPTEISYQKHQILTDVEIYEYLLTLRSYAGYEIVVSRRKHVQKSTDVTTVPNTYKYRNNRSSVPASQSVS